MESIIITQEDILKYVANENDFWIQFQKGLSAPFSMFYPKKDAPLKELITLIENDKNLRPLISLLFENFPVLKGEFPVGFDDNILLTNYRYLEKRKNELISIPIHNIISLGERKVTNDKFSRILGDKETFIECKYKNNSITYINIGGIEHVQNVRNAKEFEDLGEAQKGILETSLYELDKKYPSVILPKFSWERSLEIAKGAENLKSNIEVGASDSKSVQKEEKNEPESSVQNEKKIDFGGIEIFYSIFSLIIVISAFTKWAYSFGDIRITDYLPTFKIVAVINGIGSFGFLSNKMKAKRTALIALVINLIMCFVYWSSLSGTDKYGTDRSQYITIHLGFWIGFISTAICFTILTSSLFSRLKKN
jgi:hypothetical protein